MKRTLLVVVVALACTVVVGAGAAGAAHRPSGSPTTAPAGYWLMTGWGTSFAFDAPYLGSPEAYGSDQCVNSAAIPEPPYDCLGPSAAPVGAWLVASDGGVFAMDGATYHGSIGGHLLNRPVVGIVATPDGQGYREVARDGGIFAFGDAGYHGSMGNRTLHAPVTGLAAAPGGSGYWEVAAAGGVFAFGDAPFAGSAVGQTLDAPIAGITAAVCSVHARPFQ